MTKEDLTKFVVLALIVLVVLSVFVENPLVATASSILAVAVLVGVLSLGAERGTELLKIVLRFIFGNIGFLKFLQPSGAGSVLLAFVVSYAGVTGFDVSVFSGFEVFTKIDPELISLLTIALTWLGSTVLHRNLPEGSGTAQALK
jgi:hypothetical protein